MAKPPPPRAGQRIAKLLARAGIASRRDVERMIEDGRVALNGAVLATPATILSSLSGVTVDGQPVRAAAPARLFRYHKPAGLLTAARDPAGRPTIYDRLPADLPRVMPVGRLDLATEGLLLLTTDGELKRQLELPSTGVKRTYRARAFGTISQEQLEELIHGVEIEGIRYGAIDANLERRTGRNQWIELTLTEGKNREVRRVLEHFELQVSRLIRTAYGPFALEGMPPGGVEEVRQHELVAFRQSLKGSAPIQPSPLAGASGRPSSRRAEDSRGLSSPDAGGRPTADRVRGRTASAAQKTRPRATSTEKPIPRPPRKPATAKPRTAQPPAPTPEKPAKPKRGPGWAKAKPRPSSRPTKRGGAKPQPTRNRPGGSGKK